MVFSFEVASAHGANAISTSPFSADVCIELLMCVFLAIGPRWSAMEFLNY